MRPLVSIPATVRVALFLACAASAGTAQICLERLRDHPIPAPTLALEMVDLDGDGDVDLATAGGNPGTLAISRNLGDFAFAPPVLVASPASTPALDIVSADLDGDGDVDLATASLVWVAVFLQQPGGAFVPQPLIPVPGHANSIAVGDFDGDGDQDLATVSYLASGNTAAILLNQGAGTFAAPVTYPVGVYCEDIEAADVDGDLDLDLAVVEYSSHTVSILRNQGGGAFAAAVPWVAGGYPFEIDGADLDGDGDLDWAVADAFALPTGGASRVIILWNDGTGGYPTMAMLPTFYSPHTIVATDLDLDGDADVAVANWNGNLSVYENLGAGAFAEPIVTPLAAYTAGLRAADLDGDGDPDLAAVQDGQGAKLWRNCGVSGVPYCFGDGSGTACPCGNASPSAASAGCRNSLGLDPTLRASGSAQLRFDELVLAGAGMPNSSVLYFQGTNAISGGVVFGDGLRCAGGSVARIAVATNVANASLYPAPGQPPVSVRGGVTSPGSRVYQAWFRDPAAFCTSATFGLTNGVRVVWQP